VAVGVIAFRRSRRALSAQIGLVPDNLAAVGRRIVPLTAIATRCPRQTKHEAGDLLAGYRDAARGSEDPVAVLVDDAPGRIASFAEHAVVSVVCVLERRVGLNDLPLAGRFGSRHNAERAAVARPAEFCAHEFRCAL